MKAAIYLRISSDPTGQQLGVTRQREDCERLCTERGWTWVEYPDNDTSASSGKPRKYYERMLADIRDGRIGAVVVWHLDRLHRSPIELERFMALADERGLALATVTGDVDLSTDDGQFMARIMGAVARKEIDRKRARQLRAARQKAERGLPQWVRAFGYLDDTRQPDPRTAPLVKGIYAHILAGGSIADGVRMLNDEGTLGLTGKPWTSSTLSLFLRKARNAGLRSHNGAVVGQGSWPGLVDVDTWQAVQSILSAPGRAPGRKTVRKHRLTGVMQCGRCGEHLTGQWAMKRGTGPERHHRIYYACKGCRGVSIAADQVEPLIYDTVALRLARPDAVDLLKSELHDDVLAEQLRAERSTLLARLDEVADERADGLLTGQQAKRASDRINDKLAVIDRRQQDEDRQRVFEGVPLGEPEVIDRLRDLSDDRLRSVIDVLVEFVVMPVGRGHRVNGARFDPDRVAINWK